jgi:hypothetical protein
VDLDSEPGLLELVPTDHFWKMVKKSFGSMSPVHLYGLFKRCITIIGGRHSIYVRLPSEDPNETVHAYSADGVSEDWLKAENKKYLDLQKQGQDVKYPNYDDLVQPEQAWAKGLMTRQAPIATPEPAFRHVMAASQDSQAGALGGLGLRAKPPRARPDRSLLEDGQEIFRIDTPSSLVWPLRAVHHDHRRPPPHLRSVALRGPQ